MKERKEPSRILGAILLTAFSATCFSSSLELDVADSESYGFRFNNVDDNRESASFTFSGQSQSLSLAVDGYDIDNGTEIEVQVNGASINYLSVTPNNSSGPSTISIPVNAQVSGENTLEFVQRVPGWRWGVTNLLLKADGNSTTPDGGSNALPYLLVNSIESQSFGYRFNGVNDNREFAAFTFLGQTQNLSLSLDGYDIDNGTEIDVRVNGTSIDHLSVTPDNASGPSSISIPANAQIDGENTLEFVQRVPGWRWGITNLLLAADENPSVPDDNSDVIPELQVDNIESQRFGYRFEGVDTNREFAEFTFIGQSQLLSLSLDGFDIDNATEIDVQVNGTSVAFLSVTPDGSSGPSTLSIPANVQMDGENTLKFLQRVPGWQWGITGLLLSTDPEPETSFPLENYSLVFEDNFNGAQLDDTKWDTSLLWGPYFPINNEEQLYVDTLGMHSAESHSPFKLTGSTLKITATAVSDSLPVPPRPDFFSSDGSKNPIWEPNDYSEYRYNGPYTDEHGNSFPGYQPENVKYLSGIITSYDSFKMTHGYVETRAKVPAGQGLWPAFWLLNTHYVEDVPEIDVMEFLGHDVETLYNTYHYFDIEDDWRKISTPSLQVKADDWTEDFHTFGMAWSPKEIIWYVDGIETNRVTDSEYVIANQAMYLLANLAVGGNWPGEPDATTQFPATFEIDYIRAYERKLDPVLNLSEDYTLQFRDEFNGSTLDPDKWNTHLLWGPYLTINREEQYYVDALGSDTDRTTSANTPFVIDNGMLSITAREKNAQNSVSIPESLPGIDHPIWRDFRSFARNPGYAPEDLSFTSGIITSYDAFKFSYGYAEARMRLPNGSGLWPAFWLLNGYYVGEQPEIDIIEARGGVPDRISHNFYTNNGGLNPSDGESRHLDPINGYQADFHRYGVRWRPGRIDWYIDREIVHTYETSNAGPVPYQNMYVIANLAVGGNFFVHPSDPYDSPVNDLSDFPAKLDIDYIRVWQEKHKE